MWIPTLNWSTSSSTSTFIHMLPLAWCCWSGFCFCRSQFPLAYRQQHSSESGEANPSLWKQMLQEDTWHIIQRKQNERLCMETGQYPGQATGTFIQSRKVWQVVMKCNVINNLLRANQRSGNEMFTSSPIGGAVRNTMTLIPERHLSIVLAITCSENVYARLCIYSHLWLWTRQQY